MDLLNLVTYAVKNHASDIHITAGLSPVLRINGNLINYNEKILNPDDIGELTNQILNEDQIIELNKKGEFDTLFCVPEIGRFRINVYKQRGSYGIAIRTIPLEVPTVEALGLPKIVRDFAMLPKGLVLVTGPTGSGKSTTLASIIDLINKEKRCHILTLEDPIEYSHKHNKSIVNQREIGEDSQSFSNALRSGLRQDPDVILVGEMRDLETMSIAITAAETGHLVFSTLHTIGAAKTIDRIIDVFPPHQQQQVKVQLSSVIEGVISQQLLPKANKKGRVAAFEIMVANPAIRNLIREDKTYQIDTSIQTGKKQGMQTMDNSLLELYNRGIISQDTLLNQAVNLDIVRGCIQ